MLELFHVLGEDPLQCFSGEGVAWVFGEFLSTELEIMVVVEFPKFDVDNVEILVAEEIGVAVDIGLSIDILDAFKDLWILELPRFQN